MNRPEYQVRLLPVAEDDLIEIVTYIALDRPSAAEALANRIEERLAQLSTHPKLGTVPREDELARIGYRYLVVEDYLIFYMIDGRSVIVHRVLHGARDYLGFLQD